MTHKDIFNHKRGRKWQQGGHDRIYFYMEPEMVSLEITKQRQGRKQVVVSASLNGKPITPELAGDIKKLLTYWKLWYDVAKRSWHHEIDSNDAMAGDQMAAMAIEWLEFAALPGE